MMRPHTLTCRDVIQFLDDYCEGMQPEAVRTAFDRHLAACAHCREYLVTYRETMRLSRDAMSTDDPSLALEVPAAIQQAILDAVRATVHRSGTH
jgi:anti-sigma factor RsiW